jgi:hypothetical protein
MFAAPFKVRVASSTFAAPFKFARRSRRGAQLLPGLAEQASRDAAPAPTARSRPYLDVGRCQNRRGTQVADGSSTGRSAPSSIRAPRRLPGARHAADTGEDPFATAAAHVRGRAGCNRTGVDIALPHRAFLGAERSCSPDRRSRTHERPLDWNRRAEDPHRTWDQPGDLASRRGLGRSLPCSGSAHPARGAPGARLRSSKLEEAHP